MLKNWNATLMPFANLCLLVSSPSQLYVSKSGIRVGLYLWLYIYIYRFEPRIRTISLSPPHPDLPFTDGKEKQKQRLCSHAAMLQREIQ
jgi:hypothetical protein